MAAALPHVSHRRRAKHSPSAGFGLPLYACAVLSGSLALAAIAGVFVLPEFIRILRNRSRHSSSLSPNPSGKPAGNSPGDDPAHAVDSVPASIAEYGVGGDTSAGRAERTNRRQDESWRDEGNAVLPSL